MNYFNNRQWSHRNSLQQVVDQTCPLVVSVSFVLPVVVPPEFPQWIL